MWIRWKQLGKATVVQLRVDNVPLLAGGVAFYAMLALVPAIVAAVSLYGLIATHSEITSQIASLTQALPVSAQQLVSDQLKQIFAASSGGLGLSLALALAVALWSASSGMRWMLTALTAASGDVETRRFVKIRGLALLLTLGAIVALGVLLGVLFALPVVFDHLGLAGVARFGVSVLRYGLLAVFLATALEVLYRVGPAGRVVRVRWLSTGSVVAAVVGLVGSAALSIYASNASKFKAAGTYGALGAVVVLLLWLFVMSFAIILGAVVNAQLRRAGE